VLLAFKERRDASDGARVRRLSELMSHRYRRNDSFITLRVNSFSVRSVSDHPPSLDFRAASSRERIAVSSVARGVASALSG